MLGRWRVDGLGEEFLAGAGFARYHTGRRVAAAFRLHFGQIDGLAGADNVSMDYWPAHRIELFLVHSDLGFKLVQLAGEGTHFLASLKMTCPKTAMTFPSFFIGIGWTIMSCPLMDCRSLISALPFGHDVHSGVFDHIGDVPADLPGVEVRKRP